MFSTRAARLLTAAVLVASIAALLGDLARTSIRAAEYLAVLSRELDQLPAPKGMRRNRVERFHKSRIATVITLYVSEGSKEEVLAHYKETLEARGWSWCGRSTVGDIYTFETTTRAMFCRGQFHAIVEWGALTSGKAGTYSVQLEWNTYTWRVWLASVGLLWVAGLSAVVVARGLPSGLGGWRRLGGPHPVRVRSAFPPAECASRLSHAPESGFAYRSKVDHEMIRFELEKRRGVLAHDAFAPYLYGVLQHDPSGTGTLVKGHYGFHPIALAVGVVLGILAIALLAIFVAEDPGRLGGALLTVAILLALMIVSRWARRADKREISAFITRTLQGTET